MSWSQYVDIYTKLSEEHNMLQRQLAATLEIDSSMFSKIERGVRPAKLWQVVKLAELYHVEEKELLVLWLADQVMKVIKKEELGSSAIYIVPKNLKVS